MKTDSMREIHTAHSVSVLAEGRVGTLGILQETVGAVGLTVAATHWSEASVA